MFRAKRQGGEGKMRNSEGGMGSGGVLVGFVRRLFLVWSGGPVERQ